jgi:hypothetical protein
MLRTPYAAEMPIAASAKMSTQRTNSATLAIDYLRSPELARMPVSTVAAAIDMTFMEVGRLVSKLGTPNKIAATAAPATAFTVLAAACKTRSLSWMRAPNMLLSGSTITAVSWASVVLGWTA